MSWRTSLAGIPAGLAFLLSALSQPGPWTWPRVFLALAGALVAVLSAFAGDHRREVPSSLDVFRRVARREMTPEEGAALLSGDPPGLPARAADPPEPDAVELAKRDKGEQ